MNLKLTGNFAIFTSALLAALSSLASSEPNTNCPQEKGFSTYSEINFENSSVCISSNGKIAKLILANENPPYSIIENNSLIDASEIKEGIVHLEKSSQQANLYFEYPKNTYLISFDASNERLIRSTQSIKTEPLEDDLADSVLTLKTEQNIIISADLKSITKNSLFGKEKLEIASETKLKITSTKAYLWNSPDDTPPTKMYLIKGDKVIATKYKNGRLKIKYTTDKGRNIEKWINISSIL